MNGRILLDTSILVSIYDSLDFAKQDRAIAIADRLIQTKLAVISTQVISEFFVATTRAQRPLLSQTEASDRLRNYMNACHVVDVTQFIILEAIRGVEAHNLGFWDAQIWATAKLNQISEVYSEDFNAGIMIEGVRFTNPLTEA